MRMSALVAALALTGHDAEARDALAALPRTALHRAAQDDRGMEGAQLTSLAPKQGGDPRFVEMSERGRYDGLRKAGVPEE